RSSDKTTAFKIFHSTATSFPIPAETPMTVNEQDPLTFWNFLPHTLPFVAPLFSARDRLTRWSLGVIGMRPIYQGRGSGRGLVQKGLERVKHNPEGDRPVCVVSSVGRHGFYQKRGF
ncbi:hypothetical protein G647_06772, partial [Cladophialophora carrionii CBS 160.54]